MDVPNTMRRAKALMQMFKKLTEDNDGDKSKAAGELDADLGMEWRAIVDKSGLEFEIPKGTHSCKKEEKLYKRIKRKMESMNMKPDYFPDKNPHEETNDLKSKVQILIVKDK